MTHLCASSTQDATSQMLVIDLEMIATVDGSEGDGWHAFEKYTPFVVVARRTSSRGENSKSIVALNEQSRASLNLDITCAIYP